MNKLNYANAAALIADFNAGAKFEAICDGKKWCDVTSIVSKPSRAGEVHVYGCSNPNGVGSFRPDGTCPISDDWFLVKVADAPKAAEPSLIYPLPFKTFDELVEAYEAGTEFVVEHYDGKITENHRIRRCANGIEVLSNRTATSYWSAFNVNGWNAISEVALKVRGEIKRKSTPAEAPLLKRFVLGEDFHCPKTGENLFSVVFSKGALHVYLRDPETSLLRISTNYKHDGIHKFDYARSLVPGVYVKPVPPAPKKIKATIYKHAYNGSLFVIREGEVLPEIRGINNAKVVGETEIDA